MQSPSRGEKVAVAGQHVPSVSEPNPADAIFEYAFAGSYDFLNKPEESSSFFQAFVDVARMLFIVREVPGASRFLLMLGKGPAWAQPRDEGMRAVMKYQKVRCFLYLLYPNETNSLCLKLGFLVL
jgi:hypothetical protein